MPFKSDKQRKYLFANEPKVARKFADETRASGGMVKKALGSAMRLPDLARMRSGGMIANGSKRPKGVVDSNVALCNKFRDN
jgi:hypothetical protein|tara:strand:- start:69 stop:311 length:243 start_codon:yes stop_codon:yes gene_type:complete